MDGIVKQHTAQMAKFRAWTAGGKWDVFHSSHYDWWAFPIDEASQHGTKYTVDYAMVEQLQALPGFLSELREGVRMLMLSWGWDVTKGGSGGEDGVGWIAGPGGFVENPASNQRWARRPVRLYKAGRSCQIFGLDDLFRSLENFAQQLKAQKASLTFSSTARLAKSDVLELWRDGHRKDSNHRRGK